MQSRTIGTQNRVEVRKRDNAKIGVCGSEVPEYINRIGQALNEMAATGSKKHKTRVFGQKIV